MKQLGDDFKPCSWYRDRWMYKGYSIKASAQNWDSARCRPSN